MSTSHSKTLPTRLINFWGNFPSSSPTTTTTMSVTVADFSSIKRTIAVTLEHSCNFLMQIVTTWKGSFPFVVGESGYQTAIAQNSTRLLPFVSRRIWVLFFNGSAIFTFCWQMKCTRMTLLFWNWLRKWHISAGNLLNLEVTNFSLSFPIPGTNHLDVVQHVVQQKVPPPPGGPPPGPLPGHHVPAAIPGKPTPKHHQPVQ